jgi:hypothetical protein
VNWQLDYLVAGNDIDVVVNDTIQGVDTPTLNGLTVAQYDPPNGSARRRPATRTRTRRRLPVPLPARRAARRLRHDPARVRDHPALEGHLDLDVR